MGLSNFLGLFEAFPFSYMMIEDENSGLIKVNQIIVFNMNIALLAQLYQIDVSHSKKHP